MTARFGIILTIFALKLIIFGILRIEDKQLVFNQAFTIFALGIFTDFASSK